MTVLCGDVKRPGSLATEWFLTGTPIKQLCDNKLMPISCSEHQGCPAIFSCLINSNARMFKQLCDNKLMPMSCSEYQGYPAILTCLINSSAMFKQLCDNKLMPISCSE